MASTSSYSYLVPSILDWHLQGNLPTMIPQRSSLGSIGPYSQGKLERSCPLQGQSRIFADHETHHSPQTTSYPFELLATIPRAALLLLFTSFATRKWMNECDVDMPNVIHLTTLEAYFEQLYEFGKVSGLNFNLNKCSFIPDFLNNGDWDFDKLNEVLPVQVANKIMSIPLELQLPDNLLFKLSKDGDFCSKDVWNSISKVYSGNVIFTEAFALLIGLKLCVHFGIGNLWIESDSLILVNLIKGKVFALSSYWVFLVASVSLIGSFQIGIHGA
ncbi:hypothetical protein M5K25_021233 [Dendrobium thyrsiflorum]|uniref:RNase H type-1 domain-containing protein n=1 Tax=Dendrobium thyrsiflorum TaxID=117978 RepID=A0ABD0UC24_DENTH